MWKNRLLSLVIATFLVLSMVSIITIDNARGTNGTTLYVRGSGPGNYSTIQEAIDIASPGDTIFVFTGIYPENIVIDKSVYLIGEDKHNTIIKSLHPRHTVLISSDYVTVNNFTIKGTHSPDYYNASIKFSGGSYYNTITNCNLYDNYYGIWFYSSKYNDINNCTIFNNTIGIWVHHMSSFNTIHDCTLSYNSESGIYFCCTSSNNKIYHNNISFNGVGAKVDSPLANLLDFENKFYLNNFINNSQNARNSAIYKNFWDNGSLGNYWSDYDEESEGAYDNDSDGIIDSPYVLSESQGSGEADNYDNYPLRYPLMNYPLQYGVKLSCSNLEKSIPPRGNTTYEILVTNTGNIVDTISIPLPLPCDCGWIESLSTESVELLPNQNMTISLTVSTIWDFIPIRLGYWTTTLTASSQGDPTKSDTLTVNTSIIDLTTISIDPPSQTVKGGDSFTINITVDPIEAIAGVQFDLSFDPSLLTCNNIMEGDLFQAHDTYFMDGTIDDNNGTIMGVAGITIEGNTSLEGTFATINFTTKNHSGTSPLNLTNVAIGTPEGVSLTLKIYNGSVTVVWEPWDINRDGRTNILDLIIIGQHWGETGPPCWIPYDVNCDGVINILDMILVGQHWTG